MNQHCINKYRLHRRPGFLPGNQRVLFVGNGIPTYNLFHRQQLSYLVIHLAQIPISTPLLPDVSILIHFSEELNWYRFKECSTAFHFSLDGI